MKALPFVNKLIAGLLIFIIGSCSTNSEKNKQKEEGLLEQNESLHFKLYRPDSSGWGYDVFKNEHLLIHQPHVPAINGVHTFKSKEDASKAAMLTIYKLSHNINPPSISIREVDSLGVEF